MPNISEPVLTTFTVQAPLHRGLQAGWVEDKGGLTPDARHRCTNNLEQQIEQY